MKNKYLVISNNGKVYESEEYLKMDFCSKEMSICIRREVNSENSIEVSQNNNKRSYLELAEKYGFSWEKNSVIGFINYDYKANLISQIVQEFARSLVNSIGFPIYEVKGSNFFDMNYPVVQAYAGLFGDRLFKIDNDNSQMVMSYDASYPQFNLAGKYRLRKEDLPFAHFSISDCYRYEQSGECMLMYRGRRFFMPDLHPYFKDVESAWEGYFQIEEQLKKGFQIAKKKYLNIAKVSSLKNWEEYKNRIIEIAVKNNIEILVDIKCDEEERYWIVDIDYSIIDSFEQVREIGCIQIDVGNSQRLGIKYIDENNEIKFPVIIHAAVPGGIERFIYMLLDSSNYLPIEFAPIQVRLIPVGKNFLGLAERIEKDLPNLRVDIDDRNESVGKRVKLAKEEQIELVYVVGEKERGLLKSFVKQIESEVVKLKSGIEVPFIPRRWPVLVSKVISNK